MATSANGARRRSAAKAPNDRRALVLAGGGITGLAYEIGALRALDDLLVGNTVNDFDVYVGTSAGALVAALLANGVTPTEMALGLEGSSEGISPPTRWTIYRPNVGEAARNLLKVPELLRETAWELIRHPSRLNPLDILGMMSPLLPSGLFTSDELSRYLRRLFAVDGLTDDFASLNRELHIVTCSIDTGERVVFSRDSDLQAPISSAVAASGAIPVLFKPVRIDGIDYVDGGIKGISAIDIAVDRGASLIVVINPVVPVDTRAVDTPDLVRGQIGEHLRDSGMRAIYNQVMRGMLHDGLLDHIRLVRDRHPDVDILLIEPRASDDKMFFHELMSFSARLMVMQHGYESVSNGLQETWGYLRRILPKHGIHITRRVVERKPQASAAAIESTNLLRRVLRQTVLARRPRMHVIDDSDAA
jgi:predicted acylesterase/phospholipase RssA